MHLTVTTCDFLFPLHVTVTLIVPCFPSQVISSRVVRVYLIAPAEVGRDDEANPQDGACDRLNVGLHGDGGDLVDTLFDRETDVDVVQHLLHSELLLLQAVQHNVAQVVELAERVDKAPQALIDHLAEGEQSLVCPHLSHVRQVRDEREAVHLSSADVRLQQDVDLAVAVLHPTCSRQLTVVTQQLLQLLHLLITDLPTHVENTMHYSYRHNVGRP
ncbi:hypothetical protein EYF80_018718 [Liparis tanakae]|uniref:Uncharacterized protein n=1 Tax=Liparis tanakae TaxID=230148 RepID=A0A4Z2HZ92_9TELE|nr:hypothetical protein EYF80_018718 [Liparis tanakae]